MSKKITSLRIDPVLWKRAKIYATKNDLALNELVDLALKRFLEGKE